MPSHSLHHTIASLSLSIHLSGQSVSQRHILKDRRRGTTACLACWVTETNEVKECAWGKKICTRPTRAAKAGQKSLVPSQRTKQRKDASSFVPHESPFASVSTVSRGHPSLVSLVLPLTFATVKLSKDDGVFYSLCGSTPSAPPLSLATVAERILLNQGNQLEISWPRRRRDASKCRSMEHPPTASYLSAKKKHFLFSITQMECVFTVNRYRHCLADFVLLEHVFQ